MSHASSAVMPVTHGHHPVLTRARPALSRRGRRPTNLDIRRLVVKSRLHWVQGGARAASNNGNVSAQRLAGAGASGADAAAGTGGAVCHAWI